MLQLETLVKEVQGLLRWIAELIVTKNWFALLVLLIIANHVLFTPPGLNPFSLFGDNQPSGLISGLFRPDDGFPDWYVLFFLLVELGLSASALVIAVRTFPRVKQDTLASISERKAIKGLRPFSAEDAEIFAKLQRTQSLRECLEALTSDTFRIGILKGESGCGKTSFLQAGVWPVLVKDDATHFGIYIRFSDEDPIHTIAKALAEQLNIPLDKLISESAHTLRETNTQSGAPNRLIQVLSLATNILEKPLVLLFDQFEQFFVHFKRSDQRQPFIQGLTQWYRNDNPLPVKILVSIRSDLAYHLDDLHQALGYALGPQEVFPLKKFTPEEAADVLEVIATAEGLAFDRRFVTELTTQELANREDEGISPVDLQILAWMIERQSGTGLRAFNREAFQKFGGVEGLLQRFLERTLQARVTTTQRESAMKVLLALTDLDRQVRAGILTAPALEGKLKGTLKPGDVKEAVTWLARGDVRLITPHNEQEREIGYELAHERLIPALMQQAGKELSAAAKANQLLDRRVNEWLGNNRQSRYWFGPLELRQIERQLPYLTWEPKKQQKKELLRLSRRLNYGIASAVATLTLVVTGFTGWWLYTPWGQIQQVRVQIFSLLDNADTFREAHAALAYAKQNQWQQTQKILQNHVAQEDRDLAWFIHEFTDQFIFHIVESNSVLSKQIFPLTQLFKTAFYKSDALTAIAHAYSRLNDSTQASILLLEAIDTAKNIENDFSKAEALAAIADTASTLNDSIQAITLFSQAIDIANDIEENSSKARALTAITDAIGSLNDINQAASLLSQAIDTANDIEENSSKARALTAIADAYRKLGSPTQPPILLSQTIEITSNVEEDYHKSNDLIAIINVASTLPTPEQVVSLLSQVLETANNIEEEFSKAQVLKTIAEAVSTLPAPEQAVSLLSQVLETANNIEEEFAKAEVLIAIADAHRRLDNEDLAITLLTQASQATADIEKNTLLAIADTASELNAPEQAVSLLSQVLETANNIEEEFAKAEVLIAIADAHRRLDNEDLAITLLTQASQAAASIEDNIRQSYTLVAIARAYNELKDSDQTVSLLSKALETANSIRADSYKSDALQVIVSNISNLTDPDQAASLLSQVLESANSIENDADQSDALQAVVKSGYALTVADLKHSILMLAESSAYQEETNVPIVEIAKIYAQQSEWGKALAALQKCRENERIIGLAQVLTARAEQRNLRLIRGSIISPQGQQGVVIIGYPSDYTFNVMVQSQYENCDQYVDWVEVLTPAGVLKGRTTYDHPHAVDAQNDLTFTATVSSLKLQPDDEVIIRAHFHGVYEDGEDPLVDSAVRHERRGRNERSGYTDQALQGSVAKGFHSIRLSEKYAEWLEREEPLPQWNNCKDE